jgi:uncharacterized protein YfaP (DUF2135 family)
LASTNDAPQNDPSPRAQSGVNLLASTNNASRGNLLFRPASDGFRIKNRGSTIDNEGECYGMVFFAQWYFWNKAVSHGHFYGKYWDIVGTDPDGKYTEDGNIRGEDVIATRTDLMLDQWEHVKEMKESIPLLEDSKRWAGIVSELLVTKKPVAIGLFENSSSPFGKGHVILAYGVDQSKGELFVYNPNRPGDATQKIEYDTAAGSFRTYCSNLLDNGTCNSVEFRGFLLLGEGALHFIEEDFQNIFEDAEEGFPSVNQARINIVSHQNGDTVNTRIITLTGRISSSEVFVTRLDIWVNNTKFPADVAQDGTFTQEVSLDAGRNRLRFDAWAGQINQKVPTNMDAEFFWLTLEPPDLAVMQVTLTWNKADTDVDLYVIDPTGDFSFYQHMNTASGGELDVDDTDGYGPEHWTLTRNDTIQWGQPYRIRAHYYNDRGTGGTLFTVKLKLYEGTSQESERAFSGYLRASNPSNDSPNATGEDWWDYEVVLDPSVYGR